KMDCPDPEGRRIENLKTSDFYRTCKLPKRFEYPSWFYGYGNQRRPPNHPFYRTTSGDYGRHFVRTHNSQRSHIFFPTNQEFSKSLAKTGMYRNYSLNCGLDPTPY
ncbi:hypothetical protein NQ314_009556, partial [Rhamnusium bicolor]